jgi:membrane-associated phospholipid phosphatase
MTAIPLLMLDLLCALGGEEMNPPPDLFTSLIHGSPLEIDRDPEEEGERDLNRRLSLVPGGPSAPGGPAGRRSPDATGGPPQDRNSQQPPPAPVPKDAPGDFRPPHHSVEDAYDSHFSAKAWKEFVWEDYLTQPEVLLPAGLAVSAAAISHWDRRLQSHWFGVLGNRGYYSDAGLDTLIAAVVLTGILLPGEGRNWWDEAWTIGEAFGASSLTTFVLKTSVQRPRPGDTAATGIGTHSFPSGHSQGAFTAATLMEQNSGPLLGLPAYGLAAFTAFERVEEGRHYPSDVLAGAAIGTLSAGIFDSLHWGKGGQGGIARPSMKVALDMDGLKTGELSLTFGF